jgi:hypothetical protein
MIANSTLQQMQAREAYLHQPSRTHCRGCGQRLSDAEWELGVGHCEVCIEKLAAKMASAMDNAAREHAWAIATSIAGAGDEDDSLDLDAPARWYDYVLLTVVAMASLATVAGVVCGVRWLVRWLS